MGYGPNHLYLGGDNSLTWYNQRGSGSGTTNAEAAMSECGTRVAHFNRLLLTVYLRSELYVRNVAII